MDAEELRRAQAAADAAYEPFASITDWRQEPVGLGSWDDAAAQLAEARASAPVEVVNAALDEVLRAAAVDTGAIEGLYRADRGFTLSVARNVISLDQAEVEAGSGFRGSFEAQLEGFEHAVRLATEDHPLTEADIRQLHEITCADQDTYRVWTEHGIEDRALVKGTYKADPNHVQLGDGTWHPYAPVDRVPDEMHRLVADMGSSAFSSSPAVVQAAFVHHAFVAIHPFPDGNGRVARLLASIPLLRVASIPLWVEVADRPRYFDALAAADDGDRQPLLAFVTGTTLSLLRELALTLRGPTELQDGSDEARAAAWRAAGVLEEEARDLGMFGGMPESGPPLPGRFAPVLPGITVTRSGDRQRGLVAVVDRDGDSWSEVAVLVVDRINIGNILEQHAFGTDELVPTVSPAARRRLRTILRQVATAL